MVWWKGKETPTLTFQKHVIKKGKGSGYLKLGLDLVDLFVAEQAIREIVQHEETLSYKVKALEKVTSIEPDSESDHSTHLAKMKEQLQDARAQYGRTEYDLCSQESKLPPPFRNAYRSLRLNPKWFLRQEMVDDCFARGGCCSRQCGCCERRHLSEKDKGRGHCSTQCWCCTNFRGSEIKDEDEQYIKEDLENRLGNWTATDFCVEMANWYFCPLEASAHAYVHLLSRNSQVTR